MTKRQLSKQQTIRIQKKQANYQQVSEKTGELNQDGLVIARFSRHAEIETKHGSRLLCSIRPTIDSLVAGDRVIWQPTSNNKQGVVVSRYPRQSVLGRPDKRHGSKPVAANISQVIVVVAPKPELVWSLLDSYLVMAENLRLKLTIVLNKIDLPCESLRQELLDCYQPLGYQVLFTRQAKCYGYDSLQKALNQHVSVFVGQSGVGKSSLIAGILPHETKIQVADISSQSELGCHTTSNSRLYHLLTGGSIIDSPGVREFGLWRMSFADIVYGFREFRDLVSECKYRNCNHRDSPGCAIIKASKQNPLLQRRYDSLITISLHSGAT
jgi:ribosome biogenesis GTPase